eukprot:TRINITY_DN3003_c0_g1_i1.p1 TRINITY_DN3003_c0_g1~~TRINITY_DN3003_c0_g1_i1.p1  ORF type:complete len:175 (-),score=75.10 TRINITY_DN3003_c0_g1_i1:384-908(-)
MMKMEDENLNQPKCKMSRLEDEEIFDRSNKRVTDDQLPGLLDEVKASDVPIKALKLEHNLITDDGVDVLVEFLRDDEVIEEVILNHNAISNKGALKICEMLKENKKICTFILSDNSEIKPEVIPAFFEMVKDNENIVVMDLVNEHMDDEFYGEYEQFLVARLWGGNVPKGFAAF